MLLIKNLAKYYGKILGVKDINIEVKDGEVFGFIGPNGAGKSTTIKCIMNLVNKTNGNIYIDGVENTKDNYLINNDIGYLPSEVHLYDDLTVKQMIDYNASFYKKDLTDKVNYLVKKLEIDVTKKNEELSLGNQKKVGILLAMMHSPKLLILDEATSGLDPLMQEKFYELLEEEKKKGTTIFFSSHILNEVKRISDRIGIIKNGEIIKIEKTNKLLDTDFKIVTLTSHDNKLIKDKVNIIKEDKDTIKFIYKENSNKLIKLLKDMDIDKILIEEPSIEDIFIHYYE